MKHKILSIMAIGVMIVAFSCSSKPTQENQETTSPDTVVVKFDSTSTELPQDSIPSN